ncbi:hypothetical protein HED49_01060 [Ochrobactrum daejeonense]|nr:hypothetical protein [Brucella daejeonensis]
MKILKAPHFRSSAGAKSSLYKEGEGFFAVIVFPFYVVFYILLMIMAFIVDNDCVTAPGGWLRKFMTGRDKSVAMLYVPAGSGNPTAENPFGPCPTLETNKWCTAPACN